MQLQSGRRLAERTGDATHRLLLGEDDEAREGMLMSEEQGLRYQPVEHRELTRELDEVAELLAFLFE